MVSTSKIDSKASKALYIAVKPLEETVNDTRYGIKYNCLVFDPLFDRTNYDALKTYRNFFQNSSNIKRIPIITEQDSLELFDVLVKNYGAILNSNNGGIITTVHIPQKIIGRLVQDLTENPLKYFANEVKTLQGNSFSESYY